MNEMYKDAFSEVDAILELMPEKLLDKIPKRFRQIIKNEKSTDYKPKIKEPIEEIELKEETLIILALIYRDFLCDNEEKEKIKLRDAKIIKELEEEIRNKYSPDDIFKKQKNSNTENAIENTKINKEVQLTIIEEKWYKKIYKIIKNIFKRN